MQRGVLEVMYDECRTEIWTIDPGALTDTKVWLGKVGRIPSSTELDEYEYAGTGPMDVLMSMCLGAKACRLWWFDELGAEYWSRNKGTTLISKGDTLTKVVARPTTPSNPSDNVSPFSDPSPYIFPCMEIGKSSPHSNGISSDISLYGNRVLSSEVNPSSDDISLYGNREIVERVRSILSQSPFTTTIEPISKAKAQTFSFDRFILSDHPHATTVTPEVRAPASSVPMMPQAPSMAYLAWLAFPERDTSPRACLSVSLPSTVTLSTSCLSLDIPCQGDGLCNPLPRLCMVSSDGVGPLAGVPFVIETL